MVGKQRIPVNERSASLKSYHKKKEVKETKDRKKKARQAAASRKYRLRKKQQREEQAKKMPEQETSPEALQRTPDAKFFCAPSPSSLFDRCYSDGMAMLPEDAKASVMSENFAKIESSLATEQLLKVDRSKQREMMLTQMSAEEENRKLQRATLMAQMSAEEVSFDASVRRMYEHVESMNEFVNSPGYLNSYRSVSKRKPRGSEKNQSPASGGEGGITTNKKRRVLAQLPDLMDMDESKPAAVSTPRIFASPQGQFCIGSGGARSRRRGTRSPAIPLNLNTHFAIGGSSNSGTASANAAVAAASLWRPPTHGATAGHNTLTPAGGLTLSSPFGPSPGSSRAALAPSEPSPNLKTPALFDFA